MNCLKCGKETEKRICEDCGYVIKTADESVMNSFFEQAERKILMERENEKKRTAFVCGKFSKTLVGLTLFGALATAVCFGNGNVLSGVFAVVMTLMIVIAYLMGLNVVKERFKGARVLSLALAGVMFLSCCATNDADEKDNEAISQKTTITRVESDEDVKENSGADDAEEKIDEVKTDETEDEKPSEVAVKSEPEEDVIVVKSETEDAEVEVNPETESAVAETEVIQTTETSGTKVYITPTGKKYHQSKACAGKNAIEKSLGDVTAAYGPCKKCSM